MIWLMKNTNKPNTMQQNKKQISTSKVKWDKMFSHHFKAILKKSFHTTLPCLYVLCSVTLEENKQFVFHILVQKIKQGSIKWNVSFFKLIHGISKILKLKNIRVTFFYRFVKLLINARTQKAFKKCNLILTFFVSDASLLTKITKTRFHF